MADFDKMLKDLKEKRDELRVRIHRALKKD